MPGLVTFTASRTSDSVADQLETLAGRKYDILKDNPDMSGSQAGTAAYEELKDKGELPDLM